MSEIKNKTSMGIEPKLAGLLCYVLGWVTGLIFFIMEKENEFVRFHAMQSIVTFGAITVVQIILSFIPFIGWLLGLLVWIATVIIWIILMLNAYQGKRLKLPIAGDFAEKQINKKPAQ